MVQIYLKIMFFQFDFLNDEFFDKVDDKGNIIYKSKLPSNLQEILKDENKCKKLIIFINPPYAEAGTSSARNNTGKNKNKVARENRICEKYKEILGKANNELFAQFYIRIYCEIDGAVLATFSTLKYVNSSNFDDFRETFKAKFLKGFLAPSYTFDNVKGKFPIGFLIWDMSQKDELKKVKLDIFNENGNFLGKKNFYNDKKESINKWLRKFNIKDNEIGVLMADAPDFQNNNLVALLNKKTNRHGVFQNINQNNLIATAVYLSVRIL